MFQRSGLIGKLVKYFKNYRRANTNSLPNHIILFVTDSCNLKCKHCFLPRDGSSSGNYLSLETIQDVADSFDSMSSVSITGDEPFLREDLYDICRIFSENTERIIISTNGSMPEKIKAEAKMISRLGNKLEVQISLDGLKDTHNFIRGEEIFQKTLETIRELKKIPRVYLKINTTVTSENVDELYELSELVDELYVPQSFGLVRDSPQDSSLLLSPQEIGASFRIIKKIYRNRTNLPRVDVGTDSDIFEKIMREMRMLRFKYNCGVITNQIERKRFTYLGGKAVGVIRSSGDVSLCEMTEPVGNLDDSNFREIWFSVGAERRRKELEECFCTHECFVIPSMQYSLKFLLKSAIKSLGF